MAPFLDEAEVSKSPHHTDRREQPSMDWAATSIGVKDLELTIEFSRGPVVLRIIGTPGPQLKTSLTNGAFSFCRLGEMQCKKCRKMFRPLRRSCGVPS